MLSKYLLSCKNVIRIIILKTEINKEFLGKKQLHVERVAGIE